MVDACVCLGWSYSVEIRQIAMISKCPSMSPKIMGLQVERGSIYKQTIHYHSLPSVKRLYSYRHRKLTASGKSKYNGDHMQATSPGKTDIDKQLEESLCCSTLPPPQEKRSMVYNLTWANFLNHKVEAGLIKELLLELFVRNRGRLASIEIS